MVLALVGCEHEGSPPFELAESAVRLDAFLGSATGTYLGDGLLLTNYHVCTNDYQVLHFNDPGDPTQRYREGAPLDGYRCEQEGSVAFRIDPTDESRDCFPVRQHGVLRVDGGPRPSWSEYDLLTFGGHVVFAQKALELCIIRLEDEARAAASTRARLAIDLSAVEVGREVVVAGFPLGARRRQEETCKVVEAPRLLRDPDGVNPSDSEVVSFGIDCQSIEHGSSGSPVFDRETGALLGLIWTVQCEKLGECRGTAYVSAAGAWANQMGRQVSQYSQLQEVLDQFGLRSD